MASTPARHVLISLRAFTAKSAEGSLDLPTGLSEPLEKFVESTGVYYRGDRDVAIFHLQFATAARARECAGQLEILASRIGADVVFLPDSDEAYRDEVFTKIYQRYTIRYPGVRSLAEGWLTLRALCRKRAKRNTPPVIQFRRGQHWIPARIQHVSNDQIRLATGGPPRVGDPTQIEILTPRGSMHFEAQVTNVHHPSAEEHVGGFSAHLRFAANNVRAQSRVISWAAKSMETCAPIPKRSFVRIPLAWTATLIQQHREHTVTLSDVSPNGLFAQTDIDAIGEVSLRIPIDTRDVPMRLDGTIRRSLRGTQCPGVGIVLNCVGDDDSRRYSEFIRRVGMRATRRLVVAATGERLDAMVSQFSSVGYVVEGVSKPKQLLETVSCLINPPDLVLFDRTMTANSMDVVKNELRRLRMPILDTHDSPANTRMLVDAAMID